MIQVLSGALRGDSAYLERTGTISPTQAQYQLIVRICQGTCAAKFMACSLGSLDLSMIANIATIVSSTSVISFRAPTNLLAVVFVDLANFGKILSIFRLSACADPTFKAFGVIRHPYR